MRAGEQQQGEGPGFPSVAFVEDIQQKGEMLPVQRRPARLCHSRATYPPGGRRRQQAPFHRQAENTLEHMKTPVPRRRGAVLPLKVREPALHIRFGDGVKAFLAEHRQDVVLGDVLVQLPACLARPDMRQPCATDEVRQRGRFLRAPDCGGGEEIVVLRRRHGRSRVYAFPEAACRLAAAAYGEGSARQEFSFRRGTVRRTDGFHGRDTEKS